MIATRAIRAAAIGLLLAFFAAAEIRAQDTNYLFIVSEPMGAKVSLDGKALDRPSPLLLRDIGPGPHLLRFEKEGWYSQEIKTSLPGTEALQVTLVPKEPLVYVDGQDASSATASPPADQVIRLPASGATLVPARGGLRVSPIFPRQGLLDGVNFSLPLFLGLTAVLTVREIYSPRDSNFIISPELAASALIGGGLLAWNIDLQIRRFRFLADHRPRGASMKSLSLEAKLRFDAANQALLGGDFDAALARFRELIQDYPDATIMPKALFETGRILFIKADIKGAEAAFREVAEDYPLPELHDRARKGLADCLVALGDKEGALEQLGLLTYNGAGLTREEVELYRRSF